MSVIAPLVGYQSGASINLWITCTADFGGRPDPRGVGCRADIQPVTANEGQSRLRGSGQQQVLDSHQQ